MVRRNPQTSRKRRSVMMAAVAVIASAALAPMFVVSASATTSTTSVPAAHGSDPQPKNPYVTVGPTKQVKLQGHWVSGRPIKFDTSGHVAITRKWDSFNNCVEEDGTQFKDLQVYAGREDTRLGVTTVSSGSCFFERSKMHWQVTVLNSSGKPTGNTADIALSQGGFPRVLDYTWECNGTTGAMKCGHSDILGINVTLSW